MWTTNEASNTDVGYWPTAQGMTASTALISSVLVTSHSMSILYVQAGTQYSYYVKSKDAAGNVSQSGTLSFTTLATTTSIYTIQNNLASVGSSLQEL